MVIRGGTDARYVGTGHLVYSQGGTLFAIPFDAQSHTATGSSMPVLKGIQQSAVGPTGAAQFSVAASGSLFGTCRSSQRFRSVRSFGSIGMAWKHPSPHLHAVT